MEQIALVRKEIVDAFAHLSVPDSRNLVNAERGYHQLRALAGKSWTDLNADDWEEYWSDPYYLEFLTAEAFRYYLPSLLIACLDRFEDDNKIFHSTVLRLGPHFSGLYFEGNDVRSAYLSSLFDAKQYAAVCSFIALAFEAHHPFRAAQALRWRWNRQPHPALMRCHEFYSRMHHYEYPVSPNAEIRALVEEIHVAFRDASYPGDFDICSSSIQGDPEVAEIAMEFRGLDWKTIHPFLLARMYDSLCFFTSEGMLFFLPAYLIADLMGAELPDNDSNAEPVFTLTYGLAPDNEARRFQKTLASHWVSDETKELMKQDRQSSDRTDLEHRAIDRFSRLNQQQKTAIVSYLRFRASTDDFSRDGIEEALERYWLKSI